MDVYIIGKLIKEFRTRRKISQEELSFGLCAVSTLSKIENGKQIPNKKLAESLLNRLGFSVPFGDYQMSQIELKRWNIEYKINQMISKNDFDYAELLDEYKGLGEMDFLENQQFLFFSAVRELYTGDKNCAKNQFEDALKITVSDFSGTADLEGRLLTTLELRILNSIALLDAQSGKTASAVEIEKFLRNYYETKSVSDEEVAKNLPRILFNLANLLEIEKNYEEMRDFADEGIRICAKVGQLAHFPLQIFNKGFAVHRLGNRDAGLELMRDALKILRYEGEEELIAEAENIMRREGFE